MSFGTWFSWQQGQKDFFFEKKKQKLLLLASGWRFKPVNPLLVVTDKSYLVLFFKKERLSSLTFHHTGARRCGRGQMCEIPGAKPALHEMQGRVERVAGRWRCGLTLATPRNALTCIKPRRRIDSRALSG
jgi:hypothetical protein